MQIKSQINSFLIGAKKSKIIMFVFNSEIGLMYVLFLCVFSP